MEISSLSSGTFTNDFSYNGKELQDEFDLGWLDYGARYYDPSLGRFTTVDQLADKYFPSSPFTYVENNPLLYIDPNGQAKYKFSIELSGDVYYNSSMKEGDEGTGAMEGSGWKHMGENGMFWTDDASIIEASKNLATDFKTTGSQNTTEAKFEGGNVQKLMESNSLNLSL